MKILKYTRIDLAFYFILVLFFVYFSYLSIVEHLALRSNMNDLGGYNQALHTSLNGEFMHNSSFFIAEGVTNPNLLAKHSNYTFILLIPLYSLIPTPATLLVVQSLLVSLGALPLYWLGEKLFDKDTYLPLVIPIVYLVNPMIHDGLLYDFQPSVAISPVILFAFYALYAGKRMWFYLLAILIALTKEDTPLIVAMFGVYMIISQKKKFEGALLTVVSLVFFYINLKYLMPYFSGTEVNPLIEARFGHVGGSVDSGILTLITKPWTFIVNAVTADKFGYLVIILLPFAFLPLYSPLLSLLALPSLGINLTSSIAPMHYPLEYYYQVPIATIFCLASLFYLKKISVMKPESMKSVLFALLGLSIVTSFQISPAPYSLTSSVREFQITDHARNIVNVKNLIPEDATLSIQNNLGPHFSQRMTLYTYPYFADQADYVILDTTDPNPIYNKFRSTRTFMFNTQMSSQNYYDSIIAIMQDSNYAPIYYEDGYLVFERHGLSRIDQEELLNTLNPRIESLYERYNLAIQTVDTM